MSGILLTHMFAKVFSQIFDSTIAEDYRVRHIFMDLLVMADSDGVVDKTPQAISRVANVPLDQVQMALAILAKPDAFSRTKDHDGCRIQLIDTDRDWGWLIVNYSKYRDIRDEEARRIANRSYKREERKRKRQISQQASASNPDSQSKSAQGEAEAEAEAEVKRGRGRPPQYSQSDFDERDQRTYAASKKKVAAECAAQVGSRSWTEAEFMTAVCEDSGLTPKRVQQLEKMLKWPEVANA